MGRVVSGMEEGSFLGLGGSGWVPPMCICSCSLLWHEVCLKGMFVVSFLMLGSVSDYPPGRAELAVQLLN